MWLETPGLCTALSKKSLAFYFFGFFFAFEVCLLASRARLLCLPLLAVRATARGSAGTGSALAPGPWRRPAAKVLASGLTLVLGPCSGTGRARGLAQRLDVGAGPCHWSWRRIWRGENGHGREQRGPRTWSSAWALGLTQRAGRGLGPVAWRLVKRGARTSPGPVPAYLPWAGQGPRSWRRAQRLASVRRTFLRRAFFLATAW